MSSSRIEELPDDFDSRIDLSKAPSDKPLEQLISENVAKEASPLPPPTGSKIRGTVNGSADGAPSLDDVMQQLSKTPLFMDQLDVQDADTENNVELEAMRALQYEGTKLEIAQGFKEQGNEQVKLKRWKDGREFYAKGIAVLTGKVDVGEPPDPEQHTDEEKMQETQKEQDLLETCYVNRALCQLSIGNYRSTTLDCAAALRLNPKNVKAFYRSATALFKIDKIGEASDACARGLKIEPSNSQLTKLYEEITIKREARAEELIKKRKEGEKRERQRYALAAALKARNIKMRKSTKPPDLDTAPIHLEPDPESPQSTLVFPVIFLYPMHAQSDFVKNFNELENIAHHLKYLFPPPWDQAGLYKPDEVECFMNTTSGGLIRVGKKLSLLKLLSSGKTEVLDQLISIHVLPKSLVSEWIEKMKARKNGSDS